MLPCTCRLPALASESKRGRRADERRLGAGTAVPEDNIRQSLGRLLDALGVDNLITSATEHGPVVLHLPRRRVFIGTKRVGGAYRSPSKTITISRPTLLRHRRQRPAAPSAVPLHAMSTPK